MNPNPDAVDPRFLIALNTDPVEAEKTYRNLYSRLRRFFEWKGCQAPDDLAQETLLRGFKRLVSGEQVYCENPASYFMGIARNVLLESWKKKKEELFDPQTLPETASESPEDSIHRRMLLEKALARLSPENRDLLIEYSLEDRTELARRRGESMNALTVRVHRIRETLKAVLKRPRTHGGSSKNDEMRRPE